MKIRLGVAVLILSLAVPSAFASDKLEVSLGYSKVIGPVSEMATVIVGDDRIADATLGGGGTIILTGRGLGATNLIVLDELGRELLASPVNVVPLDRRPKTNIRVVKGTSNSQDYVCAADSGCTAVAGQAVAPTGPMVVINSAAETATDAAADSATSDAPEAPQALQPPAAIDAQGAEEQASLN